MLVNSNPATIMTDPDMADHIYIEPLTAEVIERIIEKEKPDAILPNLGGQMGLNLSMELAKQRIFGPQRRPPAGPASPTPLTSAEDRQLFKDTMETAAPARHPFQGCGTIWTTPLDFAEVIGYPVIVRPAFTLGGTGGGICEDAREAARNCHERSAPVPDPSDPR